jgi:very-short-patch-repair endonuclease
MTVVLIFAILFVIITGAALAAKFQLGALGDQREWPFQVRKPLSNAEQMLYFRLRKALPDHIVLVHVHLSRILSVKKGSNFVAWNNRISRLSGDFVVCTKDGSIAAVIEVDDSSHHTEARRIADAKKERALRAAGVRLLRWQARDLPDEAAILAELLPRTRTVNLSQSPRAERQKISA